MQDLWFTLLRTLLALGLVLGLAWLLLRAWRAFQQPGLLPVSDAQTLRFVRALPVGARERVVLIEHAGERWMLGVSAGSVNLLARWPLQDLQAQFEAGRTPQGAP